MPEAALPPASLRRVLLRLPNWLGDVCMAAPAIAALASAAPQAAFVAACRPSMATIADRLPGVVETIVLPSRKGLRDGIRAARAFKASSCDAAIVFPRSFRAALSIALARIPARVGFSSDARRLLLTHSVSGWKPLRLAHRSAYFGALLSPFGLPPPTAPWKTTASADSLAWADEWLRSMPARREGLPVVAFEPGGHYGVAKRWPAPRYAALAAKIASKVPADVVLVGTADMAPLHASIVRDAGPHVTSAAGLTTLPQLEALLARSRLLVTNDTGPMHLAAALGTPTLALFGSTDPSVCGPRGAGPATVLYEKVECAPCYLEHCPVPGHPCLDQFSVDRVLDEALALLR